MRAQEHARLFRSSLRKQSIRRAQFFSCRAGLRCRSKDINGKIAEITRSLADGSDSHHAPKGTFAAAVLQMIRNSEAASFLRDALMQKLQHLSSGQPGNPVLAIKDGTGPTLKIQLQRKRQDESIPQFSAALGHVIEDRLGHFQEKAIRSSRDAGYI